MFVPQVEQSSCFDLRDYVEDQDNLLKNLKMDQREQMCKMVTYIGLIECIFMFY